MNKLLLPLILISAVGLFAQLGRGAGMNRRCWDTELNLSTEQLSNLNELRNQCHTARIADQANVKRLRLELRQLMRAEQPDQEAINKTVGSISDHREAQEKQRVDHRLEVRRLLTPEQRVHFDTRPVAMGLRMKSGFGRGFGYGYASGMRGFGHRRVGHRY